MEISKTKDCIHQLLYNGTLHLWDLTEFISDYCQMKGKRIPNEIELQLIIFGIRSRQFNLIYIAEEYAKALNLQIVRITDKNGALLKVLLY